ncbi:MAG: four helix bundle protein [Deltaproteobacteria bacterium]|nr:four helix bundle protein [Deltaproteobacteria bacterium]
MVKSYRDPLAWQKAMDLVTEIYRLTGDFPKEEVFGLTSQLRRAAVSIPSNIAEGQGRSSKGEFQYFLGQARGSLAEVETQIIIGQNLGYLTENDANQLLLITSEVGRILNGLLSALKIPKKKD